MTMSFCALKTTATHSFTPELSWDVLGEVVKYVEEATLKNLTLASKDLACIALKERAWRVLAIADRISNEQKGFFDALMHSLSEQEAPQVALKVERCLKALFRKEFVQKKGPLQVELFQGIKEKNILWKDIDTKVEAFKSKYLCKKIDCILTNAADQQFLLDQAFIEACGFGFLDLVLHLLTQYNTISDDTKVEALLHAASNGHLKIVQLICNQGGYISAEHRGWALKFGVASNHLEVVGFLLSQIASISKQAQEGCISEAIEQGNVEALQLILQKFKPISEESQADALCLAAHQGQLEILKYLLEQFTEISSKDKGEALIQAVEMGHLAVVEYFCSNEILPESLTGQCIKKAAQIGQLDILQYLRNCDKALVT